MLKIVFLCVAFIAVVNAGSPSMTTAPSVPPSINLPPCGTLKSYDALNSPNDPMLYGFASGTYSDGSIIYPGTGNFASCFNKNPGVARIMTSSSASGPGAYHNCGAGNQLFDNQQAQYFLKHPNLQWVVARATKAASIPGVVNVTSPYGVTYIGRVELFEEFSSYTEIGNIINGVLYFKGDGSRTEYQTAGEIEILACQ